MVGFVYASVDQLSNYFDTETVTRFSYKRLCCSQREEGGLDQYEGSTVQGASCDYRIW